MEELEIMLNNYDLNSLVAINGNIDRHLTRRDVRFPANGNTLVISFYQGTRLHCIKTPGECSEKYKADFIEFKKPEKVALSGIVEIPSKNGFYYKNGLVYYKNGYYIHLGIHRQKFVCVSLCRDESAMEKVLPTPCVISILLTLKAKKLPRRLVLKHILKTVNL